MDDLLDLPDRLYYIARCDCYEWVLCKVIAAGRCGRCNAKPEFVGDFDGRSDWAREL